MSSQRFRLICCFGLAVAAGAGQPPALVIQPRDGGHQVKLASTPVAPLAGTRYRFQLQSSPDLRDWLIEGSPGTGADPPLWIVADPTAPRRFFRLQAALEDTEASLDGADVFGYARIFQEELDRVGWLTPEEFAATHGAPGEYLPGISFDPRTARFWDDFHADPAVLNANRPPNSPLRRLHDLRFTPAELEVFLAKGFTVSERLGSNTFAQVFYKIFSDDLPVFISADAILHAWHFSYQRLLEESEELQLARALVNLLLELRTQLGRLPVSVRAGPLAASVTDADYFLTVALSLLLGDRTATVFGGDAAVTRTLAAINALAYVESFPIPTESSPPEETVRVIPFLWGVQIQALQPATRFSLRDLDRESPDQGR